MAAFGQEGLSGPFVYGWRFSVQLVPSGWRIGLWRCGVEAKPLVGPWAEPHFLLFVRLEWFSKTCTKAEGKKG
jgi:hypothetical protein